MLLIISDELTKWITLKKKNILLQRFNQHIERYRIQWLQKCLIPHIQYEWIVSTNKMIDQHLIHQYTIYCTQIGMTQLNSPKLDNICLRYNGNKIFEWLATVIIYIQKILQIHQWSYCYYWGRCTELFKDKYLTLIKLLKKQLFWQQYELFGIEIKYELKNNKSLGWNSIIREWQKGRERDYMYVSIFLIYFWNF